MRTADYVSLECPQTVEYVKKHYRRRFKVTLDFTDENIEEALKVWRLGILNHLALREAVRRYMPPEPILRRITRFLHRILRRLIGRPEREEALRNFIIECGLWREGEGWLHHKTLTKIYGKYVGRESFNIEFYVYHLLPEFLLDKHDVEKCESFAYALSDELGWEWAVRLAQIEVGNDEKLHEVGYTLCCTQRVKVDAALWKTKKATTKLFAKASLECDLANYVLHSVKICKEVEDWENIEIISR